VFKSIESRLVLWEESAPFAVLAAKKDSLRRSSDTYAFFTNFANK
jgi:hypothetical protein